jgi:hypothetical protein
MADFWIESASAATGSDRWLFAEGRMILANPVDRQPGFVASLVVVVAKMMLDSIRLPFLKPKNLAAVVAQHFDNCPGVGPASGVGFGWLLGFADMPTTISTTDGAKTNVPIFGVKILSAIFAFLYGRFAAQLRWLFAAIHAFHGCAARCVTALVRAILFAVALNLRWIAKKVSVALLASHFDHWFNRLSIKCAR